VAEMPTDILAVNQKLIEEFRANGMPSDRPLLLLTTTGPRTGLPRTSPVMYVPDGARLLVIASNKGAATDPRWYRNLVANPAIHVEVGTPAGTASYDATALVTTGIEHDELWARIVAAYPFFADHQANVDRRIPVVALERA
jgi:deazaflavin-dependent oxidoreductase (nitroreductase family)